MSLKKANKKKTTIKKEKKGQLTLCGNYDATVGDTGFPGTGIMGPSTLNLGTWQGSHECHNPALEAFQTYVLLKSTRNRVGEGQ